MYGDMYIDSIDIDSFDLLGKQEDRYISLVVKCKNGLSIEMSFLKDEMLLIYEDLKEIFEDG